MSAPGGSPFPSPLRTPSPARTPSPMNRAFGGAQTPTEGPPASPPPNLTPITLTYSEASTVPVTPLPASSPRSSQGNSTVRSAAMVIAEASRIIQQAVVDERWPSEGFYVRRSYSCGGTQNYCGRPSCRNCVGRSSE